MRQSLQNIQQNTRQPVRQFVTFLSVVTVSEDKDGVNLSIQNLVNLATILMVIWNIQMIPNRIGFEIMTMVSDIRYVLVVAGTLLEIGLNSLAWGMLT